MKKSITKLILTIMVTLGMTAAVYAAIPENAVIYGGHSYAVINTSMTWSAAKAKCEAAGGHLATITSKGENDFLTEQAKKGGKNLYWIGFYRNSVGDAFKWVTGENVSYTNWAPGEPNNHEGSKEFFTNFYAKNYNENKTAVPGQWNDQQNEGWNTAGSWHAQKLTGYICEWDYIYNGEGLIPYTVPENDMDNTIRNTTKEEIPGASYPLLQARAINVKTNSFTLKWNKLTGATKYLIYGNKCNSNGKRYRYQYITTTTKTSYKPKGLKKNTFYKYIVVAVANDMVIAVSKTVHVGLKTQPNPTKVTVNKKKITISTSAVKKFQLKCSIKGTKLKQHRKVAYETDNVNVAKVNKKGLITAIGPGRCNVYAYAQNGVCAKITVTVLK